MIELSYAHALNPHCISAGAVTGVITTNLPKAFLLTTTFLGGLALLGLLCFIISIRKFKMHYKNHTLKAKHTVIYFLFFFCGLIFISFPLYLLYEYLLNIYHQSLCPANYFYSQF